MIFFTTVIIWLLETGKYWFVMHAFDFYGQLLRPDADERHRQPGHHPALRARLRGHLRRPRHRRAAGLRRARRNRRRLHPGAARRAVVPHHPPGRLLLLPPAAALGQGYKSRIGRPPLDLRTSPSKGSIMPNTPHVAIIGAGIGGMAAAYDLRRAGLQVTIFEAADQVGGLASGFKEPHWDWSVERFYHHWFQTDNHMLGLIEELGWSDKVLFPRPKTVVYAKAASTPSTAPWQPSPSPVSPSPTWSALAWSPSTCATSPPGKPWNSFRADEWMRKWYGESLYATFFEPMLVGKFGPHYQDVNMAWMWARLKTRTTRLGTFQGGFQAFCDLFAERLRQDGVEIRLSTPVQHIEPLPEGGLRLDLPDGSAGFRLPACPPPRPACWPAWPPRCPPITSTGCSRSRTWAQWSWCWPSSSSSPARVTTGTTFPNPPGIPFLALVEHTNLPQARILRWRSHHLLRRLPRPGSRILQPEPG